MELMLFQKKLLIFILFLFVIKTISGQTFYALPIAYYTPETRWGFGVASVFIFSTHKDSLTFRKSNINFGAAFTQNKQKALYLPFQLYLKKHKYWLYGELGYYKYVFDYFGIGPRSKFSDREKYSAKFPRVRMNALQRINVHSYLGFRYVFDDYRFTRFDSTGALLNTSIFGAMNGTVSGLGLVYNVDSRDQQFFPTKGTLLEAYLYRETKFLGSDYNYGKVAVDVAKYFRIKKKNVLACQLILNSEWNRVPFHQLNFVGGNRKLRGIIEGQYRDRNLIMWQTEWRAPLFWKFKYVCFAGIAIMGDKPLDLLDSPLLYSYGAGIRILFSEKQKLHLRLDYAFSKETSGFYFTIGEAF